MRKPIYILLVVANYAFCSSCKKFIEVDPPTNKSTEANVFDNDLSATAVITGLFSNISNNAPSSFGLLKISKTAGLSADEFDLWSGASAVEIAYYHNDLKSIPGGIVAGVSAGTELWNFCYPYIYRCNQAIIGIANSEKISPSVKQQLLGETKFIRAFLYFYLVNLYGDVPLAIGIDPEINRRLPRAAVSKVYDQVISDLKEAQKELSESFLNSDLTPGGERVRPTKWAATALLARVYLYTNNFAGAELEATNVINQTSLFDLISVPLNKVFLKNSKEAIWELQPVIVGWNTTDARWFDLAAATAGFSPDKSVYLSSTLYNDFEPGDDRKNNWIGAYLSTSPAGAFYFPSKYKAGKNTAITATNPSAITEYHMVLRLAEQYLIRAEARAKLGNTVGAVSDLNIIRARARATPTISVPNPLPDLPTTLTQSQVLDAVMQERRVELFSEWGHRWFDLKRTGRVDSVMSMFAPLKGGSWQSTDQLYPIPVEDISANPNLTQNAGY